MDIDRARARWTETWVRTFRALRGRNYRWFFFGQGVSLIGTWMQTVAMGWLVYRLTHSAFLLGLVGFTSQLPMLVLMPFAGVLTERRDRRNVLVATQSLALVQAAVLAALTLSGTVRVWQLVALSAVMGAINAFDMPTRQAFTIDMVERKEDLANAIALNSSLFNASRLLGPTAAGVLIATVGEGICFLLNSFSYLAVILALLAMRLPPRPLRPGPGDLVADLRAGLDYAFGFLPIRAILLLLSVVSLVGIPYMVLMPVFAKDILRGGPGTLGVLMGASGVGALLGALYLASRRSVVGLGRWIAFATALFGASLIAFAWSRSLAVSLVLLAVSGFGMIVAMAASNTILQTIAEEDKRGRLMSLYALSFAGLAPFGSLLAGGLSSWIGAPATLTWCGAACLLGTLWFARQLPAVRAHIRPIYRAKGILPDVAAGLQNASEPSTPAGGR
jgi:MFS family permease